MRGRVTCQVLCLWVQYAELIQQASKRSGKQEGGGRGVRGVRSIGQGKSCLGRKSCSSCIDTKVPLTDSSASMVRVVCIVMWLRASYLANGTDFAVGVTTIGYASNASSTTEVPAVLLTCIGRQPKIKLAWNCVTQPVILASCE